MTNCITAYFSFCSVESVKHSNKGFQCRCGFFFFFAPMLLIAKCNSLIMTLNKCVLKKKRYKAVSKQGELCTGTVKVKSLSRVRLFATPWTVAYQAPPFHGILQARILQWVAISFSRGSSRPRDRTQVSSIPGRCFNL